MILSLNNYIMKVRCKFNDPSSLPTDFPNDFDYGLSVGQDYLVMGMVLYKDSNHIYYLLDTDSKPNWFPYSIFEIIENSLPCNWFSKPAEGENINFMKFLWGFEELCNDKNYYHDLIQRHEKALRIYFKRKIELENMMA